MSGFNTQGVRNIIQLNECPDQPGNPQYGKETYLEL